jgi:hypothetical protein
MTNPNGTGAGVFGRSRGQGEGVRGETSSNAAPGVVGLSLNPNGTGAGVFGRSEGQGEGVHGETNSLTSAAVVGITLNASGSGAGVFAQSKGPGPAGLFEGNALITADLAVQGVSFLNLVQRLQRLEHARGPSIQASISSQLFEGQKSFILVITGSGFEPGEDVSVVEKITAAGHGPSLTTEQTKADVSGAIMLSGGVTCPGLTFEIKATGSTSGQSNNASTGC